MITEFKLNITADVQESGVKDACVKVVSNYLKDKCDYFDVNYVADNYYARMVDEYKDLDTRIHKLEYFVNTDNRFRELSIEKRELCILQLDAMKCYRFGLNKRIELERREQDKKK